MDELLTDWFPPETPPVNEGWYETYAYYDHGREVSYMRVWKDGEWFYNGDGMMPMSCTIQRRYWRGRVNPS